MRFVFAPAIRPLSLKLVPRPSRRMLQPLRAFAPRARRHHFLTLTADEARAVTHGDLRVYSVHPRHLRITREPSIPICVVREPSIR
jgi:hypothetical protein